MENESELITILKTNNSDMFKVIKDAHDSTEGTISSIVELDKWQKKLTKLLSDALQRYFDINVSAKKYSVYINSLVEKIENMNQLLLKLENSENKNLELSENGNKLR